MRKKLFSRQRRERQDKEYYEKQKLIWECVRRNKEYMEDFYNCGNRELNDDEMNLMAVKWSLWSNKLPDPYKPFPEMITDPLHYPNPYASHSTSDFFSDLVGMWRIEVIPPATEFQERRFKDWTIYEHKNKTFVTMDQNNYPRSVSITVSILPWRTKGDIEIILSEEFESAYKKVKDAQDAVLGDKPSRPRCNELGKYIQVYDLKKNNPGMSWSHIARQIIPESTYQSQNKKGKKRESVQQWAIDKVRYYYRMADNMINKGGWKEL